MVRFGIVILLVMILGASCRPKVFPPKPVGYFKVDTPATHTYKAFNRAGFPYSFEYPTNSIIVDDTVYQKRGGDALYWINVYFPDFDGVINITYREINEKAPYMRLVLESDSLSNNHMVRADYIDPFVFSMREHNVSGILYTVAGNTATRYQFTVTDTVKHFVRGALYFNATPNADSLKPVTTFVERDIKHLLETLTWH